MAQLKMPKMTHSANVNVILLVLTISFFALLDCGSTKTRNQMINADSNLVKNPVSAFFYPQGSFAKGSEEILPSEFPRFKRQAIPVDESTRVKRKSLQVDESDSDSDYEVGAKFPDYDVDATIDNGTRVDPSYPIPYQLSIRFHKQPLFGPWLHVCGATILDENTAITAAHCFDSSKDVSRYRVVAGENLLDVPNEENEQVLEIQRIIIHPKYTNFSNGHDIAILHVSKIQLNEHRSPVWLSPFPAQKLYGLTGVISGWGQIVEGSQVSNILQKGSVSILSANECQRRLKRHKVPFEGILCALDSNTRACNGDSGGPLVIQNYKLPSGNFSGNLLVGIISFRAIQCDRKNSARFTTEISYFYDWIQENRAKKPCEESHLPCIRGGCFHSDFKCDEKEDCADGTDEIECSGKNTTTTTTETPVVRQSLKPSISSCSVVMEFLPTPRSKKQTIYPHGNSTSLEVLCDFETDGGGWTIFHKRTSGPKEEFQKNWNEYQNGFGSLDKNFWLGLENIRALTKNGDQELRIELEDFQGAKRWAKYSNFAISDASDFYRLTLSGFYENSTAGDSMTELNNGQRFTTVDTDNDEDPSANCAVVYGGGGGWWFNWCSNSNLNGLYFEKGETVPFSEGIYWYHWKGWNYSLAKSEMKIRKRKP